MAACLGHQCHKVSFSVSVTDNIETATLLLISKCRSDVSAVVTRKHLFHIKEKCVQVVQQKLEIVLYPKF